MSEPSRNPFKDSMQDYFGPNMGWKAFFALLMSLQVIAIAVMWRTYDAIDVITTKAVLTEYKVDHVIYPQLLRLERQLENLPREAPGKQPQEVRE